MGSKLKLTIILTGIALTSIGCLTHMAYAVGSGWVNGKLYTSESEYIPDDKDCNNYVDYITASDEGGKASGLTRGCIVGGDEFAFMRSHEPPGSPLGPHMNITGIMNPADNDKMPRELKRSGYDKFWNFGGVDALVQSDLDTTSGKTEVLVYIDLPRSLYAAAVDSDGTPLEYQLNPSSAQHYTFDMPISSMLMSDDKKYLVVKYYGVDSSYGGFRKIDLTTGKSIDYVVNNMPSNAFHELRSMTQDGRYVIVGDEIYDLSECTRHDIDYQECKSRDLNEYLTEYYGHSIWADEESFKFIDHDSHLDFSYSYQRNPTDDMPSFKNIELSLIPHIEYLALGDSYSSGEGDLGKKVDGSSYYTPDTDPGCHLSDRSYPFLLRDAWHIPKGEMQSVACSGALVGRDYTGLIESYDGQRGELQGLSITARQGMVESAYDYFVPGRIPQLEFVKRYKPKIITLTGSGNDVGFAKIIESCAGDVMSDGSDCAYVDGGRLHDVLNDAIDSQYQPIRELIKDIKEASPGVNVYYVGYPSFIGGSEDVCALNSGALSRKERDMINQSVSRLNRVIREASASAGAEYIDVENVLDGGRLCEGSEYMNGIWDTGLWNSVVGHTPPEAFHPNPLGHKRLASAIANAVSDPVGDYHIEEPHGLYIVPLIKTLQEHFIKDTSVRAGSVLKINLPPGSVQGNSVVHGSVFSTELELGDLQSNEDGSLDISVRLPKSFEAGAHVVLLNAKDDNGRQIRFYEYIEVGAAEDKDANPGGVKNIAMLTTKNKDTVSQSQNYRDAERGSFGSKEPLTRDDKISLLVSPGDKGHLKLLTIAGIIVVVVGSILIYDKRH